VTWILQSSLGLLIGALGYMASSNFDTISAQGALLQIEVRDLRRDLSAMELSLRSDRFSRSDWITERKRLDEELNDIRKELKAKQ